LHFQADPIGFPTPSGQAGRFWLYGVVAVAAWVFFYFLVPETKGKSLEQIEAHWRTGKRPTAL